MDRSVVFQAETMMVQTTNLNGLLLYAKHHTGAGSYEVQGSSEHKKEDQGGSHGMCYNI